MTKPTTQTGILLLGLGCFLIAPQLPAATPPFTSNAKPAVAWSSGNLRINGTAHSGSANVAPESAVETTSASGQLYLADGSRLRIGSETNIAVGANSLHLARGVARIDAVAPGRPALPIRAGELEIRATDGIVSRGMKSDGAHTIDDLIVSAQSSPVEVRKQDGVLLAMVRPGETLSFAFGKARVHPRTTELNGVIREENGKYYVTDQTTNVKVELSGKDFSAWKNKQVRLSGELNQNSAGQSTLAVKEVVVTNPATLRPSPKKVSRLPMPRAVLAGVVVTSAAIAGTSLALVGSESPSNISTP